MRENKYERILKEAAHLIGQKGYSGTSFQEIADQVGIHKSTLFHYFRNKEELLFLIMERSIAKVSENLEEITNNRNLTPEEKLKEAIDNHLRLLVEYYDNVNVYLNEFRNLSQENKVVYLKKRKKYEGDFRKIITEMKTLGYFERLNPKIVTFGILGMLNWTAKWFRTGGAFAMKEISNVYYKMITRQESK